VSYLGWAEPKFAEGSRRRVRNLVLEGWRLLFGRLGFLNLLTIVVFGQSMFSAEESLAILALEGENLFFAAVGTLQFSVSSRR